MIHIILELLVSSALIFAYISAMLGACAVSGIAASRQSATAPAYILTFDMFPPEAVNARPLYLFWGGSVGNLVGKFWWEFRGGKNQSAGENIADQAIGVPGGYWTGAASASASCPMAKRITPD